MKKFLRGSRFRIGLAVLGFCLLIGVVLSLSEQTSQAREFGGELARMDLTAGQGAWSIVGQAPRAGAQQETGTIEKMIVSSADASLELDLNQLNGRGAGARMSTLLFTAVPDSFFTIIVFNGELRGSLPSTMGLVPQNSANLPAKLNASLHHLGLESTAPGSSHEFVIRDMRTGFVFFNIEGALFDYDADGHVLGLNGGRLLISTQFASEMGRTADAGKIVGQFSTTANMRSIEITEVVNGETTAEVLPGRPSSEAGTVPGPDVIVGELSGLQQFGGSFGGQVGLAVGTDACNAGTVNLNWFANPANDHPTIPQNLYRMSGGPSNTGTFEQIGQSNVKHAFTALTQNLCGFGCNGVGGQNLGSGCSDPYSASLNAGPNLGARAWINPFTGFYPRNDSATPNNNHTGHNHSTNPTSHKILTNISDLNTSLNVGATYYAESQYVTPHEYVWCQSNPTQCNMNNNVSYRKYNVSGTGSPFSFSESGETVQKKSALNAWTGATVVEFRPDALADGIGAIAYKVTNPSPGVWHYEYAIHNQNLDRAIQSFSVPMGQGVSITNVGFHTPPQQPGWTGDGTAGNTGFSSAAWTQTQTSGAMVWSSETFAQNPNANAVRWGTLYNVRFDSNRPPVATNVTLGFFKTGSPLAVPVQGPSGTTICFQTAVSRRCPQ